MEIAQKNFGKEEAFGILDEIHACGSALNLQCITHCTGLCEDGPILLLPFENEYLSERAGRKNLLFPRRLIGIHNCGFIADDEPDCIALESNRAICILYPVLPVDCLTYPVFPRFTTINAGNDDGMAEFFLSAKCPLASSLGSDAITLAKRVWLKALRIATKEWREIYNEEVVGYFTTDDATRV